MAANKAPAAAGERQSRPRDREVIDIAADVFARQGYARSTVQDVADALGILKGSVYYYIDTKEDLLFRLLLEVHEDVDRIRADVTAIDGLDPLERLTEYVRVQTAYNLRNVVKISVYYNDIDQLTPERHKEMLARRKRHEDFVVDLIQAGQKKKLIDRSRDARLLSYFVFSTIVWPYQWYRPRGQFKADAIVAACVDYVTHGLSPR
jgi:AcrR family transcriptional regulator